MAEAGGAAARAPVPLTVIGGYLGAGKTTLLNRLLRHSRGRRLAVLVNDFGSVSIDAELIERREGETISLSNGCICCSLAGGFAVALTALRERADPPEHIVVEASGVADPRAIVPRRYDGRHPAALSARLITIVETSSWSVELLGTS